MPYKTLQPITRGLPLSYSRANDLLGNQVHSRAALLAQHTAAGAHNLIRAARGVALVKSTAGVYSLVANSAGITAVAKNGTGDTTLTLSATNFKATPYIVQLTPADAGAGGPLILNYKLVSNTSIRIFNNRRGGAWAAEDDSYWVAIHSDAINGSPNPVTTARLARGSGLSPAFYNALAVNSATTRAAIIAEHTTNTGAHNAREIPKCVGQSVWSGGSYVTTAFYGSITSAAKVSAGVCDVSLPVTTYLNNPNPTVQIFLTPAYASDPTEQWAMSCDSAGLTNTGNYLTKFRTYLWKKSAADTWTLTDGSFFFSIHTA